MADDSSLTLMQRIYGPYYTPRLGGYRGGRPASEMGPPEKIPSGFVKPCRCREESRDEEEAS